MSAAEMNIRIGADVSRALAGLNQVTEATAKTGAALNKVPNVSNQATLSLSNLSRVVQDAPYGFIGIANNINPLLESFQRLKASTGSTGGALKALGSSLTGAGGLGLAVGVASSLMVVFGDKLFGASKKAEELKKKSDEVKSAIDGIFSSTAKEATEVGSLITVLKSETETRARKLAAIQELQKIQPEVFNGLKLEGTAVAGLDQAYQNYISNLKNVIAAKILQVELEAKIEKLLKMQGVTASSALERFANEGGIAKTLADNFAKTNPGEKNFYLEQLNATKDKKQKAQAQIEAEIKDLFNQLKQFSSNIKIELPKADGGSVASIVDPLDITKMLDLFTKRLQEQAQKPVPIQIPVDLKVAPPKADIGKARGVAVDPGITKRIQQYNALGDIISNVVTPAFDDMFAAIGRGENVFKAFGQAIVQSLTQLIAKLVSTIALAGILSLITGGAAGIGFKGLAGFKNIFSGLMGFRAGGGPMSAGLAYRVGERGPETFIPETSGRMVPASQGRISQGSMAMALSGQFRVSGNDLVLVLANANRSQNRLV